MFVGDDSGEGRLIRKVKTVVVERNRWAEIGVVEEGDDKEWGDKLVILYANFM